ncbi:MAG: ABC transporter ATP-binding protein [Dehalococcoidia bacterium]|nr:ABC transporter ATP-binding protein [Dehalococcoidia bacterium]
MSSRTRQTNVALHCVGLTKRYADVVGLDGVDLTLIAGQTVAIVGPSGCGKTTLLRLIAGLEVPDGGTVEAHGRILAGSNTMVGPERRRVGIVFQDYALFPHLTVWENVEYGISRPAVESAVRIQQLLSMVGIAHLRDRMPDQLSGGEQQRVALARALGPEPEVLLMDEPFSNLDTDLRARVRREIKDVLERAGVAVAFVTHDQEEALFMADRVAVMRDGRIEQVDTPERIFHAPSTTFVGRFMGTADFLAAHRTEAGSLITEIGPIDATLPTARQVSPDDAPIHVMVRPDDLSLEEADPGIGLVGERTFTGPSFVYRVTLDSGTACHILAPHTSEPLDAGTRVAVRFSADHPLTVFVEGRSVEA